MRVALWLWGGEVAQEMKVEDIYKYLHKYDGGQMGWRVGGVRGEGRESCERWRMGVEGEWAHLSPLVVL